MNTRIIYKNENSANSGVSIIIPSPECILSIEEIISMYVPSGVPYKVVDVSDIPSDRTFRDAWEWQD